MLENIILCPGASLLWLLIIRSHMLDWKCNTTSKTCRQQQESLQKLQFTDVINTFSHVFALNNIQPLLNRFFIVFGGEY